MEILREDLLKDISVIYEVFPYESRMQLNELGAVEHSLTGESFKYFKEEMGVNTSFQRSLDSAQFESIVSRRSQVAVFPDFYIPEKRGRSHSWMKSESRDVFRFARNLRDKVSGVNAITGNLTDYINLDAAHLGKTGEHIFSPNKWIKTSTISSSDKPVLVGLSSRNELTVREWSDSASIYSLPLIIPFYPR